MSTEGGVTQGPLADRYRIDPRAYRSFDAATGGRRFLVNLIKAHGSSRHDDVAMNWPRLLLRC